MTTAKISGTGAATLVEFKHAFRRTKPSTKGKEKGIWHWLISTGGAHIHVLDHITPMNEGQT